MTEFRKSEKLAGVGDQTKAPTGSALGLELFGKDILVLRDPAPDTAAPESKIVLPDQAKRDPHVGAVVLTAPDCKLKVGDRVRFASYACGQPVELRGTTYLRMSETLVWAREVSLGA